MNIGETQSEKDVTRLQESRNIVKEILKFGVSDDQKLDIIYYLTLELENRSSIIAITDLLKKIRTGIKPGEESQYVNKEPDSGKNKLLGV
ncbi:MAG: hypothetical protein HN793_15285 [Rhodospirillaceae bacterium]|jgi:hypothetical protein|nr:hypothetical protein [Rhodospirillaceae bacterium]